MLRDFDDAALRRRSTGGAEKPKEIIDEEVESEAVANPVMAAPASKAWEAKDPGDWSHEDLRDYVVHQIEQKFGRWPRDPRKEISIFKSFLDRWGTDGIMIAIAAFEVFGGWWHSSPVVINRFCKGSDPYFAQVIMDRLKDAATAS